MTEKATVKKEVNMSTTTHRREESGIVSSAYLPVADSSEFLMQVDRALSVTLGEEDGDDASNFAFRVDHTRPNEDYFRKVETH